MTWSDHQLGLFVATLPASPYLSLHYDNPMLGGTGNAEFTGGSYVRAAVSLSALASRAVYNTNPVLFTNLGAATLKYLGICDAASGGNLCAWTQVLPVVAISSGGQFSLNVGDLAITW